MMTSISGGEEITLIALFTAQSIAFSSAYTWI